MRFSSKLAVFAASIALCGSALVDAQVISTVAGGALPATPVTATNASLARPTWVATGANGVVYFTSGNAVYKVSSGTLMRVAGSTARTGYAGDGGPATSATLNAPAGLAVDASGNLYIADSLNNRVRKVAVDGTITTIAGMPTAGYSGDAGLATSATLRAPAGLAFDATGNLYIADEGNHVIRKITTATGIISTYAGNAAQGYSGDGVAATTASLNLPAGIAFDAAGNLYISDSGNNMVRKVTPGGVISRFAGTGTWGFAGDGASARAASLADPQAVAVDAAGNVYVSDFENDRVRKIGTDLKITTYAGGGVITLGDGQSAIAVQISNPWGLAISSDGGTLYIADGGNRRVRGVSGGVINTLAGGGADLSGDGGAATQAMLAQPAAVAVDASGALYIADQINHRVRKVAANGTITTIAGTGTPGYAGDGGLAVNAMLDTPMGVAVDSLGNVYVAEYGNHTIRQITSDGKIQTIAGSGVRGSTGNGGRANLAQLAGPSGVSVDAQGNLYIADTLNNQVRKIDQSGNISAVAGSGVPGYAGDAGAATSARLYLPSDVVVDTSGNVYIADSGNSVIRKVGTDLKISTFAGTSGYGYSGDGGSATAALLGNPTGVAVDGSGNVYIADGAYDVVRVVSGGKINLFAGNGTTGYSGDLGAAKSAQLSNPLALAFDANGNLYIADADNDAVRVVVPASARPVLGVANVHQSISTGASAVTYSVIVSNAASAAATSGQVSVTLTLDAGLTLQSASGTGWSCTGTTCTRSDALQPGASYPAIAVTASVTISANTAPQLVSVATVSGGGALYSVTSQDLVNIPPPCVTAIAPNGLSLGATAVNSTVIITAPAGCAWTVASAANWVTVTAGASGTGSGSATLNVAANGSATRTATVSVGGVPLAVTQLGAVPASMPLAGSLAHVSSGGNWNSAITLVNLGASSADARMMFYSNSGAAQLWPFTYPQTSSSNTTAATAVQQTLAANAQTVLNTQQLGNEQPGSAQLFTNGNVNGFTIFQYLPTGQQAVVPLETRNSNSYTLAFDNTGSIATGLAIANLAAAQGDIAVTVRKDDGTVLATAKRSFTLSANGHDSFMLTDSSKGFPETAGIRGTVEFTTPASGRISVLGLRVNNGAVTTLPVLADVQAGAGGALAHIATGGGWETGFTLVNTGTSATNVTLNFFADATGTPLSVTATLPQSGQTLSNVSSVTQTLNAGQTLLIQTASPSGTAQTGSAQLVSAGSISGFAIFRFAPSAQEAVVPLETRSPNSFVLAYDNSGATLSTGLALSNLSGVATVVNVNVRDDAGNLIATAVKTIPLAANGHTSFMLVDATLGFPETAGKRGTIEFVTPGNAKISALGIRVFQFSPTKPVITTIPVLAK